jgi:hypothetical protein
MLKLIYHSVACQLLGVKPTVSLAAVKAIEEAEQKAKLKLPASIREWYSLKASDVMSHSLTRDHVLKAFRKTANQAKKGPYQLLITLDEEHDGGYAITMKPGDDDPEVVCVYESVSHGQEIWGDFEQGGVFSQFILGEAYKSSTEGLPKLTVLHGRYRPPITIQEKVKAGPPHIDFVLENGFEHVWRHRETDHGGGEYCFVNGFVGPRGRVCISTLADPWKKFSGAMWELAAKKEEDLFALYELLWPMHGFTVIVQARPMPLQTSEARSQKMKTRFLKRFPTAKVE